MLEKMDFEKKIYTIVIKTLKTSPNLYNWERKLSGIYLTSDQWRSMKLFTPTIEYLERIASLVIREKKIHRLLSS